MLSDHIKQDIFLAFQIGGCLFVHESSAESSCRSFLHYFYAQISNHLSIAISMSPDGWLLKTSLNVHVVCCVSAYKYDQTENFVKRFF